MTIAAAAAVALASVIVAGCGRPAPATASGPTTAGPLAPGGGLRELVTAGAGPLRFEASPTVDRLAAGGERRDAVIVPAGRWSWHLRVPPHARLRGGVQLVPGGAEGGGVQTTVTISSGGSKEALEVIRLFADRSADDGWLDLDLDLGAWSGRDAVLEFDSVPWGVGGGAPLLAWAPLRVVRVPALDGGPDAGVERSEPPSILLIVADTLRRDRVSAYAGALPTTPEIHRLLAGRGVVFERAYAQAPWTAPSVASYLTGRHPEQALAPGGGIAAGVPTLAELLRARGYRTAAFVANPLLGGRGAYERGFESFYGAGVEDGWLGVRADELTARAEAWLRARRGERFFLYVHYVDPHSPYSSPWDEAAFGVEAEPPAPEVEDLRWGRTESADPRDAERIAARYDGEVRYLDAAVGRLIEALPPRSREDVLTVFTADHGEELLDHGWWGHGRTLYEELIRVPLLMRRDGHLAAGDRVEAPVRLLDLMPTLLGAAGAPPPPGLDGVDLWPALSGGRVPAGLSAFAQHIYLGPPRAAAVRDSLKLILFDREADPAGEHPLHRFSVDLDRRLLSRVEAYDLARDPGERRNLAASGDWTPELAALADAIHARLHRRISGLRVIAGGLPAGTTLRARVRCTPAPAEVSPYFLAPGDRVDLAGGELRLTLAADPVAKGVVVGSGCDRVEAVETALEGGGSAGGATAVRIAGAPWPGLPADRRELSANTPWPPAAGGPALDLWSAEAEAALEAPPRAGDESLERLRALGYLGE